jgi:transcriptional regulator with XRE-family HTH domain/putative methionine-R-sulfoxide reductase with GAF domain
MNSSKGLQKLLANFVFRDSRLESHPKVSASSVYFLSDDRSYLELAAMISRQRLEMGEIRFPVGQSVTGRIWSRNEASIVEIPRPDSDFVQRSKVGLHSFVGVPVSIGSDVVGVLSVSSNEGDFFRSEDVGRLQLLGALIAFINAKARGESTMAEAATLIGRALAGVRTELGMTQDEVAYRGGLSRIALSQWEHGRWPTSFGPIYKWCAALGLVADQDEPQVSFLDVTPQLIMLLGDNPNELRNLSPERFEHVVAERIDRMGYDVQLTGATTRRDGGIDLIAVPKIRTLGSFLMAVQVKHHRGERTTGRPEVDRMLAWKDSPFRVGVMVTNTAFSHEAKWLADQVGNRSFLRLRDFEDLKRWLKDQFDSEFDWREIPDVISLAPGITVHVPKGRLQNSRQIWPLSGINLVDEFPEDK